ncbi:hypothetical protein [Rhodopirellula bahusiensis]|uniref:Uncharacterized protein n=1 Tax=Rhodopirellula bahusiensis TaxID=2014065 RepID=A0A2G1W831_9BACT|nr:hypothetical protein [Rhodopirellula bahusiensis]PHQ35197.1 hypothetical protein CEE69_12360 [Rhodopirellula bahusiensis]
MPHWPSNWLLDAAATAWIATGVSTLAIVPVGAVLMQGSLADLLTTDDAWVGLATIPWVAGFVLVGTACGNWFESTHARWMLGLGPLLLFALFLVLLDCVEDLGEGEQVVTAYGVGILLAGLFSVPAFIFRERRARILLMTAPQLTIVIALASFPVVVW